MTRKNAVLFLVSLPLCAAAGLALPAQVGGVQVLAQTAPPPKKAAPVAAPNTYREDVTDPAFLRVLRVLAPPIGGGPAAVGTASGTNPGYLRLFIDGKLRNKPTHYRHSSTGNPETQPWRQVHWGGVARNAEDFFVGDCMVPAIAGPGQTITIQFKNDVLWRGTVERTFFYPR